MSKKTSSPNDSNSKKIRTRARYVKDPDEPRDNPFQDSTLNDETVLKENSPFMRRRFRFIAKRIRIIKIYGIKKP